MARRVPMIAARLARLPRLAGAVACALAALVASAAQAGTNAGTRIPNTATLSFLANGERTQVPSNTVELAVDELLDVAITAAAPQIDIAASDTQAPVAFVVQNLGNAEETFTLVARIDRAGAAVAGFAADDNGDGGYDPAADHRLDPAELTLKSGERRRIFVLVSGIDAAGGPATVIAVATAATGRGKPGTVFPGKGIGGVDAIVGDTGARAAARTILVAGTAAPRLVKSQIVVDPAGGDQVIPGSIVTYTLEARFPGATPAVELADPVPAGTEYVAGSITVDGQPATDGADGDAATFEGNTIRVALGDVAAAAVRTIRFKAKIQ